MKDVFGKAKLPVSRKYIVPRSRRTLVLVGLGGAILFLAAYNVSTTLLTSNFVSGGPLSSNHAMVEKECSSCHSGFRGTPADKCASCHEPSPGDAQGIYSFSAHYLYRSEDPARVAAAMKEHDGDEMPCATCHPEHDGRESSVLDVSDRKCLTCHDYGSLGSHHPAFDFETGPVPDDAGIRFTHQRHTRFVLDQTGDAYLTRACLYCHVPKPDGKTFEPIAFDKACASCHLTTGKKTGRLPIGDPANPASVGVLAPETMLARGHTGSYWAATSNSGEFQKLGPEIVKSPVVHRDPWVLENLREIRRQLYPSLGLADLLPTAGIANTETPRDLYREALSTLESYRGALRSRPERPVQAELRALGTTIDDLRAVLERRDVHPSIDPFTAPYRTEAAALTAGHRAALLALADTLTSLCRECHGVTQASIARVQKDQAILRRAHFDHRAHVVDRDCLDCHNLIPMDRGMSAETKDLDDEAWKAYVAPRDLASVQNLPGIQNCRDCHNSKRTSDACVTCHVFHPDQTNRRALALATP